MNSAWQSGERGAAGDDCLEVPVTKATDLAGQKSEASTHVVGAPPLLPPHPPAYGRSLRTP